MAEEYHSAPAPRAAARPSEQQSTNAWNQFQNEHGGKGWSKQQMQQEYQRAQQTRKPQGSDCQTVATCEQKLYQKHCKTSDNVSPAAALAEEKLLSWNDFQHAHAGAGWTKADLSAAYARAKATAPTATAETLNWNAFQHFNFGRH